MHALNFGSASDASNKSKTEISAGHNLRKLYDTLLTDAPAAGEETQQILRAWSPQKSVTKPRPQSARSSSKSPLVRGSNITITSASSNSSANVAIDAIRSLRRQRQNNQSQPALPAKSLSKYNYAKKANGHDDDAAVFAKWIRFASTTFSLEADLSDLGRELKASELKCAELQQQSGSLGTNSSDLDPKLQCLEEVLGVRDFQRYLHDLHGETARFRRQFGLYRRRFQWFQQKVWETHDKRITKEACLDILNRAISSTTQGVSSGGTNNAVELVVLLSQYPVLVQHCLDTQQADRVVLSELLKLLSAISSGRERILRHLFEQIADARRGEGAKPPPDLVRPHKLIALAKQSLASGLCSKLEFDEVEQWLGTEAESSSAGGGVSLNSFLRFHIAKSDAFSTEDAEFVTYLMRLWGFQIPQDDDEGLQIAQVLKSYETRCQHATAGARKRELVAKIHNALSNHLTKHKSCEAQVQQLQVLQLNNSPVWRSIQSDARLAAQCASSLTLLKVLVLSNQCLQGFPEFVTNLRQLQVLDLSDNLIASFSPELEELQSLQTLVLSANRLTDKSFHSLETTFAKLSELSDLQLDNNQLTTLPRALPAIPGLTTLNLSTNQLKTLSSTVVSQWGGTCQLVTLDLHHNALTSLPEEFSAMSTTLRHLILHENKLEMLPAAIALMRKLESLTLSHNALGSGVQMYPATLEQRHLTLDHNQLRTLPVLKYGVKMYLEGTPSQVQSVNASWNRIRSVPAGALGSLLPLCEELNLHRNSLQELPEDLFRALPALRVCKLGCNELTQLPESILGCEFLQVLDLQQNRIQTLSPELAKLQSLVVLNAMENQIDEIPSEWHVFASHFDVISGKRVLQTLALKKNPIRSKVLKTIIDGGSIDSSTAALLTTKPNDEQLSEFAIKKIIDALHNTIEVLAMETEGVGDDGDDRDGECLDFDDAGIQSKVSRKWKGMTRNVCKYLESRLRMIQAAEHRVMTLNAGGASTSHLHVSERAFKRLLKSLPSTCSEKEMASLVSQYKVPKGRSVPVDSSGVATISGSAFLLAIDQFGAHRTLSVAPMPANSSFAISKPGDPVTCVLHYLSIVYSQQQLQHERLTSPKKPSTSSKVNYVKKNKLSMESRQLSGSAHHTSSSKARKHRHDVRQQQHVEEREAQAKQQFLQRHLDPESEVLMRRQKQRIQILEQQLMDQKLLLLSQQQQQSTESALAPAVACDSDGDDDSDDEEQSAVRAKAPLNQDESSVLVCVKCAKGQEHLPATQRWKTSGPLTFSINLDASVSAIKQKIEQATQIPVANQVLIATALKPGGGGCGGAQVRVRSDSVVKDYLEILTVESKMTWNVTLLVGESLRVALPSKR